MNRIINLLTGLSWGRDRRSLLAKSWPLSTRSPAVCCVETSILYSVARDAQKPVPSLCRHVSYFILTAVFEDRGSRFVERRLEKAACASRSRVYPNSLQNSGILISSPCACFPWNHDMALLDVKLETSLPLSYLSSLWSVFSESMIQAYKSKMRLQTKCIVSFNRDARTEKNDADLTNTTLHFPPFRRELNGSPTKKEPVLASSSIQTSTAILSPLYFPPFRRELLNPNYRGRRNPNPAQQCHERQEETRPSDTSFQGISRGASRGDCPHHCPATVAR